MSERDDGGSAFPHEQTFTPARGARDPRTGGYGPASAGMTLRDYFAAKVLTGMSSTMKVSGGTFSEMPDGLAEGAAFAARIAYVFADAMLAERAK